MDEARNPAEISYVDLAADIVSAYVSNNSVPIAELGALISNVHAALSGIAAGGTTAPAEEPIEKPTPAQIRKSVTHEGLISFVDGKSYKTLKRHLTGAGLDPVSYRQRYGLPKDYPMTAPSYSEQRSAMARSIGLGQIRQGAVTPKAADADGKARRPGRPRKATAEA